MPDARQGDQQAAAQAGVEQRRARQAAPPHVGGHGDPGQALRREANMAKHLASEASWAAANAALDTHGGNGFVDEYDIERKFRETRMYQVAPTSNNLVKAFVATKVLGLPRSY